MTEPNQKKGESSKSQYTKNNPAPSVDEDTNVDADSGKAGEPSEAKVEVRTYS